MASKTSQVILSLAMLAGAIGVTSVLYLNRPVSQITEPVQKPTSVDAAEIVKQSLRIPVQAQGIVTPLRQTALLAEVTGRIVEVAEEFNVGSFVSQGDILLRIDPRDYQTNLLRAQAALESTQSSLAQERGRAEVAAREWKKLPKGSQRSQDAKNLYLRIPQLNQAESQMLAAQADLNTARDNLERTILRAPYDALIREKHGELGQFVAAGSPLADVFSVDYAEIRLPLPQSKLSYLELPGLEGYEAAGSLIDLYTDVGGDIKHWSARLHRTEGVFDERSRVLYTVARVEDPYGLKNPDQAPLRMGTFVNANIEGRELHDIIALPRYLLRAGNYVWVIDESMHLRNRQVSTLRTGGDRVYITAGLDAGELVSLTALDSSYAGAKVTIRSTTASDTLDKTGEVKQEKPPELAGSTPSANPTES